MIRLNRDSYHTLIYPLRQVTINNLFARSVVENHVSGKVFVDHVKNPETFYVVHPYGMSLLFGNSQNPEFNAIFKAYSLNLDKSRNKHEWMQAFPNSWDEVLSDLFRGNLIKSAENTEKGETGMIELNTRINFKFNRDKYFSTKIKSLPAGCKIVRADRSIYHEMKGSVIPYHFWDKAEDFFEKGIGFSLYYENKLASTAYSAFIHDHTLELGIETLPEFRGSGFAQLACSSLIDYCLENEYEPVWACRLENTGSCRLAQKLGFEPCAEIPYYRLSK